MVSTVEKMQVPNGTGPGVRRSKRLIWYFEHNKILTDIQCGFRKRKSTVDHLVRLESFIRDAFLNKQEVVSIFFDLEKAYDTT